MRVAITGSSGFIGQKLVRHLENHDYLVIKLDLNEGINILKWKDLSQIKDFDVLVHLAAMSFVPLSYENPREFYELNLMGLINSLELCRLNNARIVFVSSYVYGNVKETPIKEEYPLNGFNPYAETKIIGESICRNFNKYFNIRSTILRPFNIYGAGQNPKFLIPSIINQVRSGVIRLKDSRPVRDYVYIDDVVNALVKAVENDSLDYEQFNIGSGEGHSVKQVAEIINELCGKKAKIIYEKEERRDEVLTTIADITKAKEILNWVPETSFRKGLEKLLSITMPQND